MFSQEQDDFHRLHNREKARVLQAYCLSNSNEINTNEQLKLDSSSLGRGRLKTSGAHISRIKDLTKPAGFDAGASWGQITV